MRTWSRRGVRPSWEPAVGTHPGWRPRYELLGCALRGHHLAPALGREPDPALSRHMGGLWWDRCLRCDAWLPRPEQPPRRRGEVPTRRLRLRSGSTVLPQAASGPRTEDGGWHDDATATLLGQRHGVRPPVRGRLLRDKYVLRLIAIDRAVHFLALAALGLAVTLFAVHRTQFQKVLVRVIGAIQGTESTTLHDSGHGLEHWIVVLTHLDTTSLQVTTAAVWAYAALELVEAFGLWWGRRWAEYLTLLATSALIPFEVFELIEKVTWLRSSAFAINVAIVVYLLFAKRLFGLRGGGRAEHAARLADAGWLPVERATPPHHRATEHRAAHHKSAHHEAPHHEATASPWDTRQDDQSGTQVPPTQPIPTS